MTTHAQKHGIPGESALYLVGATAVGKTAIAVEIAERLGAEIVGCDAFQVYDGLPILTAKPSNDELARVRHHLIGEVPLSQPFDVAQYLALARGRIEEINARGKKALVVGGTGLYLRALTRGLADVPPGDPELRTELQKRSLEDLQEQLRQLDLVGFGQIDLRNPRRVVRALEVCILTGRPFSSFQENWTEMPHTLSGVLLDRDRPELYARIDRRVEQMFDEGVVEEVSEVLSTSNIGPTACETLGFREIQAMLEGKFSRSECMATLQQSTRQYAKRQGTWFRREPWLRRVSLGEIGSSQSAVASVYSALTEMPSS